jgi:hypothetical protein
VKYFSVDALGNAEPVRTAAVAIRLDLSAPTTTDNTATLGAATKTTTQTVKLTPTDTGGSGLTATYYTTDGSDPTTASATGTTIVLSLTGSYTVKYFSTDAAGNAEPIQTASTVIAIDTGGPTTVITSPLNGVAYNAAGYAALCTNTGRICGTATDTSGVAKVTLTIKRVSDGKFFDGVSAWGASKTLTATGTTSWYYSALTTKYLTNGASYVVTVTATDKLNLATVVSSTFTYDTTAPAVSSAAVTNKNGRIETAGDTFSVTFAEALNPATVPATGLLTLVRKSTGNTTYSIPNLTNGAQDTGTTGYLALPSGTTFFTVNFQGSFALSNSNRTITFTVTGACVGSCTSLVTTVKSGGWKFAPATTLKDLAGNTASGSYTAKSSALF